MSPVPNGAICPSCGRFVGPLEQCPHCGAAVRKRLPLRYLRVACILLAVVSVAALIYAVHDNPTPKVTVASVGATMNYAYVRLEGQVTRGPTYDPETQQLRFYLADPTGEIMVSSFRAVTRRLLEANKIPVAGDHIAAEGTLRVRDDFASLNLVSPDKIDLTHPAANPVNIGDIGPDDNLQAVSFSGEVREIRSPYNGLTLFSLGDASGEIDLAVYSDVVDLTGPLPLVQVGDAVNVTGTVSFYRDSPQLVLTNTKELSKAQAVLAPVAPSRIGDLNNTRLGARVSVEGNVSDAKPFSNGMRLVLDDGSGSITLLLWQDTLAQVTGAEQLKRGARVKAFGRMSEYHGDLEVVPDRGSDVQVVNAPTASAKTPAPIRTATPAAAERAIASLSANDQGKNYILTGRIGRVSAFSKGTRVTLDDGTGTITLVLWSDLLQGFKNPGALRVGAQVRAKGTVEVYDNELELVPEKAGDVTLLALSVLPTVAPRRVKSLKADEVGSSVVIGGTIKKIQGFSQGEYLTLADGTGEIRVTVFNNVLSAMSAQERAALIEGAKVTVTGELSVYRGDLEILPASGGIMVQHE